MINVDKFINNIYFIVKEIFINIIYKTKYKIASS